MKVFVPVDLGDIENVKSQFDLLLSAAEHMAGGSSSDDEKTEEKKSTAKKTPAKKPATKKKDEGPAESDVIDALKACAAATSKDVAVGVLKDAGEGAASVNGLDPSLYQAVIDAANAKASDDGDDDEGDAGF